jgi:hypothetical protein
LLQQEVLRCGISILSMSACGPKARTTAVQRQRLLHPPVSRHKSVDFSSCSQKPYSAAASGFRTEVGQRVALGGKPWTASAAIGHEVTSAIRPIDLAIRPA